jgi:hypothetical protein
LRCGFSFRNILSSGNPAVVSPSSSYYKQAVLRSSLCPVSWFSHNLTSVLNVEKFLNIKAYSRHLGILTFKHLQFSGYCLPFFLNLLSVLCQFMLSIQRYAMLRRRSPRWEDNIKICL